MGPREKINRGDIEEVAKRLHKASKDGQTVVMQLGRGIGKIQINREIRKIMDRELKEYEEKARLASIKDHCAQHVNEISKGVYKVGDWFDFTQTVASFEDGIRIF